MNPMLPMLTVIAADDASTLSSVLGNITTALTSAVGWVGTIANTITSTPLLLVGCVLTFVGFGVGLFRRMFHV